MCIISAALEKAGPVRLLSSTGVVKQVVLTSGPSRAMAEETKITAEMLQKKLLEELPATHVEVVDNSQERCGSAFEAIIVSEVFEGKGLLAQHKLVNKVLAEELKVIHAFSQKTYTPAKFEAAQK